MEAKQKGSVWSKRLIEAKGKDQFLKLVFQYPASDRAVIKRGKVMEVFSDGFDFQEIYDGEVSYSFQFIVEIKMEEEMK